MPEYRYLGKPTKRKDGRGIVTGSTVFTEDFMPAGMLHMKYLKSPHPHAWIKEIRVEKAKAYPGVRAVITYKDIDKTWCSGLPAQKYVMDRHLRYVGDCVCICVAETEQIADEALDLVEVEYEVLKPVYTVEEAIEPDAPQLYGERDDFQFPGNEFPPGCFIFDHGGPPMYKVVKGDVKVGEAVCDIIAEGEVRYDKFPTPLPIENPICIAKWEDDGSLSAWVSTQAPHLCRTSNSLSMGGIRLNVKAFNVGGSFGSKVAMTEQVFYAAAASRAAGNAPVRWRETKSDHLLSHDLRLGTIIKGRIGMTKEGIVDLVDAQLLVDTGYTSDLAQGIGSVGLGEVQLVLAKCKNWNLVSRVIATNRTFSGAVRGFGGQEMKSVVMLLWQDAMIELGIDPVECFKKNIVTPGDSYTWRDNHDYTCAEVNFIPAIDKTAETFGWKDKWKGWLKPTSVNGSKARGVGVSLHLNADAGEDNTTAYVRIDHLGYVTIHHGGAEFGQAQRSNAMVKVAAEALNVPFEKVSVVDADTRSTPGDFGLQGSRGTKCVESAIWNAAKDCYQKILEHASELIFHNEVPPEALEFKDGFITMKGKTDMEPIPIIAAMVDPFSTITGFGEYREDFTTPNFFLNFVEVEVDLNTGYADVVEMAGGTDVGQIIDPVQLSMQIDGGIGAAGLDTAFFEGHVLDTYTGRNLTTNMIDYKMRPFNQFPKYDKKVIMESQFNVSPIKALGCGEITGAASPGAVMMAISNAIGAKVRDYPATPEVILKAMKKIK